MKVRLLFLLFYFLLWLIFFQLARLVFMLYHWSEATRVPFSERVLSFFYGMRMDLSMVTYIFIPVCIFILLSSWFAVFRRKIIFLVYSLIVGAIMLLIVTSDLEVYGHWGFRIDDTPLKFLSDPKEAWASVSHLPIFLIVLVYVLACALFAFLFNKFLRLFFPLRVDSSRLATTAVMIVLIPLLIIPMRGGLQLSPMNQSAVYFSKHHFANISALNAGWNFMHGLMSSPSKEGYAYFPDEEAKRIVDSLYALTPDTSSFLRTTKPNIVYIIWESFTEKAVNLQVEGIPVTPKFNELRKEGLYFNNMYASGDRTDKGLAAILSAYPALNKTSIIRSPNKLRDLSFITRELKKGGYRSMFYYGGETEFANIKSYLYQNEFDLIADKNSFNKSEQNSKWGAHDGVVSDLIKKDTARFTAPFFLTWLTLTSHEPYEVPDGESVIKGNDATSRFLNSIRYTDKIVFDLVQFCKQQPWWKETLVVIIGDHGHILPPVNERAADFKIPMLLLGGALAKTGTVPSITSQVDLSPTILEAMGKPVISVFGKNLFQDPARTWSFFTFNDGFGFINADGSLLFDNAGGTIMESKGAVENSLRAGKALQQQLYNDYLSR